MQLRLRSICASEEQAAALQQRRRHLLRACESYRATCSSSFTSGIAGADEEAAIIEKQNDKSMSRAQAIARGKEEERFQMAAAAAAGGRRAEIQLAGHLIPPP